MTTKLTHDELDALLARVETGRAALRELTALMDGHYAVIREYLGAERGPGFAHAVNSKLLRISGQFVQLGEKLPSLLAQARAAEVMAETVSSLRDVLSSCEEYFDQRADAEYSTDSAMPSGNEEMRLLCAVREALGRLAEQPPEEDTRTWHERTGRSA